MENTLKEDKLPEGKLMKENLRVQKTAYIKRQIERQRAAEDARLERLVQEQEVIAALRESIDDSMWQTEEARKYNREFQEHLNQQIYEAHGITEDKLTGMKEYRNALYRGAAAALFLLSLALTCFCGVLHGFGSDICLLMLAYTAVEGALADKKQKAAVGTVCKMLYILIFPVMMVMFVCYELGFEAYELFLPYVAILGGLVTVLGTISYFLYDPYRYEKKRMQDAKSQIREIEKAAEKEIRKNQKSKEKEEKRMQKLLKQEKSSNQAIEEKEEDGGQQPLKGIGKGRRFLARFQKQHGQPDDTDPEGMELAEVLQDGETQNEEDSSGNDDKNIEN